MADGPDPVGDVTGQATTDVNADIAGEIAPFQDTITQLGQSEQGAIDEWNKFFPGLLSSAQESSKDLLGFYGGSLNFEKDLFNAANQRLSDFRNHRAAEAQTRAQETGAPVPLSDFTYAADVAGDAGRNTLAAQLMHSLGYATAGVGEVEAWSGKVFPLIGKEQLAQTQRYFQDQINATQKEIDRIKAGAPARIRSRADEIRLQRQQYNLDVWKAKKDYALSQQQMENERQRIKDEEENIKLQRAQLLGYYDEWYMGKDGKPHKRRVQTLGAQQFQSDAEAQRARTKLERDTLQLDKDKQAFAEKQQGIANQQTAGQLLDAAMHPKTGTVDVTRTERHYLAPPNAPQPSGADGKDENGWYKLKKVTNTVQTGNTPITDPNKAIDFLMGHGVDRATAVATVKREFNLPTSWKPNHEYTWTMQTLQPLSFSTLRTIAISMGYKPQVAAKKAGKRPRDSNFLRQWILDHQKRK